MTRVAWRASRLVGVAAFLLVSVHRPVADAASAAVSQTPTRVPAGVAADPIRLTDEFVLPYHVFFYDHDDGELWLFGELHNTSDQPALAPTLTVEFRDAGGFEVGFPEDGAGDVLTSRANFPPLYDWAPGGGRVPIGSSVRIAAIYLDEWASEELDAAPRRVDPAAFDPTGVELRFRSADGTIQIRPKAGVVVNTGNETVQPEVHAEFYDAAGRFSGACSTGDDLGAVSPGDSVEFALGDGCHDLERGQAASAAGGPFTIRFTVALREPRADPGDSDG